MTGRDDSLDVLVPPVRAVVVRGETLEVSPLTLKQLPAFITASRPLIGRVMIALSLAEAGATTETGALLLDLLEQDAPAFAQAAAVATGRPADWLAEAAIGDIAALTEVIVSVNADFFARRLPALISAGQAALAQARAQPETSGPSSSTTSSRAGTNAETS